MPLFKDFDHDRFRRLSRLESMEGRSEDNYEEFNAERMAYWNAYYENPFRYCIRICPSMDEAFLKAGRGSFQQGAWFSVVVFNDMDVYRRAVAIIEQELGGGHMDTEDPLEYILWLERMVSAHEIHYLFEQWYDDGMKCLRKVMDKDLGLAREKA